MDEKIFDEILHMDDPNFAEKFAAAIGLQPGEALEVSTPQFERTDGLKPAPSADVLFSGLAGLPKESLKKIGMQAWGEYGLWLFPYQWYPAIPRGLLVTDIFGNEEEFIPGVTDDDMRFGALSFGIVPDFERPAA